MNSISEPAKKIIDGTAITVSVTGAIGWWTGIIALITSILSLIWIVIRIFETRTFQHYVLRKTKQYTRKSDDDESLIEEIDDMD